MVGQLRDDHLQRQTMQGVARLRGFFNRIHDGGVGQSGVQRLSAMSPPGVQTVSCRTDSGDGHLYRDGVAGLVPNLFTDKEFTLTRQNLGTALGALSAVHAH